MQSSEISKKFQNYYQKRGHLPLAGAPLLHPSIPMSFVMSAGLVQIETSLSQSKNAIKGTSYVLSQKCFRYFDIAKVGYGNAHLSLFEMPGAFSFTNNGKTTAIKRMWNFVTQQLGLNPADLWITFFAGGEVSGYHFEADHETYHAWQALGVPSEKLIGLDAEDNYWKQGGGIDGQERYRKCGPNTEIFFDRGRQYRCGPQCRPGCPCGRFIEFANSLFVRFEIDQHGQQLRLMSKPFTETVIGTERLAMILQNKASIFEIDSISPIIDTLRTFYQIDRICKPTCRTSEKIIADHLRALIFLTADGAPPPGKNGRHRLVKILIRETLTHARLLEIDILNYLDQLIETLLSLYSLPNCHQFIVKTVKQYFTSESERFNNTIQAGQRQLRKYLKQNKGQTLSGKQIVLLEKQAGLPNELTQLYLRKQGLPFLDAEYQTALQAWKASLP